MASGDFPEGCTCGRTFVGGGHCRIHSPNPCVVFGPSSFTCKHGRHTQGGEMCVECTMEFDVGLKEKMARWLRENATEHGIITPDMKFDFSDYPPEVVKEFSNRMKENDAVAKLKNDITYVRKQSDAETVTVLHDLGRPEPVYIGHKDVVESFEKTRKADVILEMTVPYEEHERIVKELQHTAKVFEEAYTKLFLEMNDLLMDRPLHSTGEYLHLTYCSGDRRKQVGTPGCCCPLGKRFRKVDELERKNEEAKQVVDDVCKERDKQYLLLREIEMFFKRIHLVEGSWHCHTSMSDIMDIKDFLKRIEETLGASLQQVSQIKEAMEEAGYPALTAKEITRRFLKGPYTDDAERAVREEGVYCPYIPATLAPVTLKETETGWPVIMKGTQGCYHTIRFAPTAQEAAVKAAEKYDEMYGNRPVGNLGETLTVYVIRPDGYGTAEEFSVFGFSSPKYIATHISTQPNIDDEDKYWYSILNGKEFEFFGSMVRPAKIEA